MINLKRERAEKEKEVVDGVVSKGEGVGTSNTVDQLGDNKTLESLKKHLRP